MVGVKRFAPEIEADFIPPKRRARKEIFDAQSIKCFIRSGFVLLIDGAAENREPLRQDH